MDNILDQLSNIHAQIELLNDDDKIKFMDAGQHQLSDIQIIINDLENLLLIFDSDEEKVKEANLIYAREYTIQKLIFPKYWAISECLYNIDKHELGKLESFLE